MTRKEKTPWHIRMAGAVLLCAGLSACGDVVDGNPDAFSNIVVVGDSIGAASRFQTAYPYFITVPDFVDNQAIAATKLTVEILATFTDNLDMAPLADGVIIQGGVNDIRQWDETTPAYNDQLLLMQQAIQTMSSESVSRGLDVMLVNITPWEGDSNWTTTKQQLTEDYNAWLESYADQTGAVLVDAYTLWLDQSGATKGIDDSYGGGPLHPNQAGATALGMTVDSSIIIYRLP